MDFGLCQAMNFLQTPLILEVYFARNMAHPIKSVASLPKYQRYTIEKERYVPNSTQLASKCLKLGVE